MALVIDTVSNSKNAQNDLKRLRGSVDGIKTSLDSSTRSLSRFATGLLSAVAAGAGFSQFTKYSDTLTSIDNKLKVATESQRAFNKAQRDAFDISVRSRANLEATATLYQKVAISGRRFAASQETIAKFTEASVKTLAIAGAVQSEVFSFSLQLGQGLASGKLHGDELRTVLESNVAFADALAKGLGKSVGELRGLGAQGFLTFDRITKAIIKMGGAIDESFAKTDVTYGQAFTNLKTGFLALFKEVRKAGDRGGLGSLAEKINDMGVSLYNFSKTFQFWFLDIRSQIARTLLSVDILFRSLAGKVNIFKPIKLFGEIDIKSFMPDLSKGANIVKSATSKISGYFKELYMDVVGNSYVPDLVEESNSWFSKFSKNLVEMKNSTYGLSESFSKLSATTAASTALVLGLFVAFTRVFPLISLLSAALIGVAFNLSAANWNLLGEGINRAMLKAFSGMNKALESIKTFTTKVYNYFKELYEDLFLNSPVPDIVNGLSNWFGKLLDDPLNSVTSFTSAVYDNFKMLAIGIGLLYSGSLLFSLSKVAKVAAIAGGVLGVASGVNAFQNKGSASTQPVVNGSYEDKSLSLWDRILNVLSNSWSKAKDYYGDFKNWAGDSRKRVTDGFNSSAVGKSLLRIRYSHKDLKAMAESDPDLYEAGRTAYKSLKADRESGKIQDNNGPNQNVMQRFFTEFSQETSQGIITSLALVAGGIGALMFRGPLALAAIVNLVSTAWVLAVNQLTSTDNFTKLGFDFAKSALSVLARGIDFIFSGNVLMDNFGLPFLGIVAKTAILFSAGRSMLLNAAKAFIAAPSTFVGNLAVRGEAALNNRAITNFDKGIAQRTVRASEQATRASDSLKESVRTLTSVQRASGISSKDARANTRSVLSGGTLAGTAAQDPSVREAAATLNKAASANKAAAKNAGAAATLTEKDTEARQKLVSRREVLTKQLAESFNGFREGTRQFVAGGAGIIGGVAGFQLGSKIAAGMAEDTPSWIKIGTQMGTAFAGQFLGAALGSIATSLAFAIAGFIGPVGFLIGGAILLAGTAIYALFKGLPEVWLQKLSPERAQLQKNLQEIKGAQEKIDSLKEDGEDASPAKVNMLNLDIAAQTKIIEGLQQVSVALNKNSGTLSNTINSRLMSEITSGRNTSAIFSPIDVPETGNARNFKPDLFLDGFLNNTSEELEKLIIEIKEKIKSLKIDPETVSDIIEDNRRRNEDEVGGDRRPRPVPSEGDLRKAQVTEINELLDKLAFIEKLQDSAVVKENELAASLDVNRTWLERLTDKLQDTINALAITPIIANGDLESRNEVQAARGTNFATGGSVSGKGGPTDDKIPAMLSNGEFVINANSTKKHRKLLEQINKGSLQSFAEGGYFDPANISSDSLSNLGKQFGKDYGQSETLKSGLFLDLWKNLKSAIGGESNSLRTLGGLFNVSLGDSKDTQKFLEMEALDHPALEFASAKGLSQDYFAGNLSDKVYDSTADIGTIAATTAAVSGLLIGTGNVVGLVAAKALLAEKALLVHQGYLSVNLLKGEYTGFLKNAIDSYVKMPVGAGSSFVEKLITPGASALASVIKSQTDDKTPTSFNLFEALRFSSDKDIPAFATGGSVYGAGGPTDDKIPAMLSNGEFVVNAEQSRRFRPLLESINSGKGLRLKAGTEPKLTANGDSPAEDKVDHLFEKIFGWFSKMWEKMQAMFTGGGGVTTTDETGGESNNTQDIINRTPSNEIGSKMFEGLAEANAKQIGEMLQKDLKIEYFNPDSLGELEPSDLKAVVAALESQAKDQALLDESNKFSPGFDTLPELNLMGIMDERNSQIAEFISTGLRNARGEGATTLGAPVESSDLFKEIKEVLPDLAMTFREFTQAEPKVREDLISAVAPLIQAFNELEVQDQAKLDKDGQKAFTAKAIKLETDATELAAKVNNEAFGSVNDSFTSLSRAASSFGLTFDKYIFNSLTKAEKLDFSKLLTQMNSLDQVIENTDEDALRFVATKQLDGLLEGAEEGVEKRARGFVTLGQQAGETFSADFNENFKRGLSSLIKGDSDLDDFLESTLDTFTNSVIDSFVEGLTAPLTGEDGPIGKIMATLGEGLFSSGEDSGGMLSGLGDMFSGDGLLSGIGDMFKPSDEAGEGGGLLSGIGDMFKPSDEAGEGGGLFSGVSSMIGGLFGGGSEGEKGPLGGATQCVDICGGGSAAGGGLTSLFGGMLGGDEDTASDDGIGALVGPLAASADIMGDVNNNISKGNTLQVAATEGLGGVFTGGLAGLGGMLGSLFGGGETGSIIGTVVQAGIAAYGMNTAATGGVISGPGTGTSDSIPAMLSDGEFIINAKSTKNNLELLRSINDNSVRKFVNGGLAGASGTGEIKGLKAADSGSNALFNLNITGDISKQTKREIMLMMPDLASGVNKFNRERGY